MTVQELIEILATLEDQQAQVVGIPAPQFWNVSRVSKGAIVDGEPTVILS